MLFITTDTNALICYTPVYWQLRILVMLPTTTLWIILFSGTEQPPSEHIWQQRDQASWKRSLRNLSNLAMVVNIKQIDRLSLWKAVAFCHYKLQPYFGADRQKKIVSMKSFFASLLPPSTGLGAKLNRVDCITFQVIVQSILMSLRWELNPVSTVLTSRRKLGSISLTYFPSFLLKILAEFPCETYQEDIRKF